MTATCGVGFGAALCKMSDSETGMDKIWKLGLVGSKWALQCKPFDAGFESSRAFFDTLHNASSVSGLIKAPFDITQGVKDITAAASAGKAGTAIWYTAATGSKVTALISDVSDVLGVVSDYFARIPAGVLKVIKDVSAVGLVLGSGWSIVENSYDIHQFRTGGTIERKLEKLSAPALGVQLFQLGAPEYVEVDAATNQKVRNAEIGLRVCKLVEKICYLVLGFFLSLMVFTNIIVPTLVTLILSSATLVAGLGRTFFDEMYTKPVCAGLVINRPGAPSQQMPVQLVV